MTELGSPCASSTFRVSAEVDRLGPVRRQMPAHLAEEVGLGPVQTGPHLVVDDAGDLQAAARIIRIDQLEMMCLSLEGLPREQRAKDLIDSDARAVEQVLREW